MPWLTPSAALIFCPLEKLGKITNDPKQPSVIGTGDASTATFTTPFFRPSTIAVYIDGVLQTTGYTVSRGTGTAGRDQIVFSSVPASGSISVTCPEGVNADVLDEALLRGQGRVRGPLDAALYTVPADDATDAPRTIVSWAFDIATWLIVTDPRRVGLLTPEISARYAAVAGIGGDLSRVAKGEFSLRGVLPYRGDATDTTGNGAGFFFSRPQVYSGPGAF
jgi:hypothetical protein